MPARAWRWLNGSLGCAEGHRFDLARQGYVNLVPAPGDTAAMVSAREAFLGAGHLDFIPLDAEGVVVDAGSGPAHHLAAGEGRPGHRARQLHRRAAPRRAAGSGGRGLRPVEGAAAALRTSPTRS